MVLVLSSPASSVMVQLLQFGPASSVRDLLKVPFRDPEKGGLFVTEPTRLSKGHFEETG